MHTPWPLAPRLSRRRLRFRYDPSRETPHTGKGVIKVEISVDFATKQINVTPYRFEVSKQAGDQVQWTCAQKHEHPAGGCFWAHFDKGSTFDRNEFRKHLELSGPPGKNAVVNKEYKYIMENEAASWFEWSGL
jgi:hypothetical protein